MPGGRNSGQASLLRSCLRLRGAAACMSSCGDTCRHRGSPHAAKVVQQAMVHSEWGLWGWGLRQAGGGRLKGGVGGPKPKFSTKIVVPSEEAPPKLSACMVLAYNSTRRRCQRRLTLSTSFCAHFPDHVTVFVSVWRAAAAANAAACTGWAVFQREQVCNGGGGGRRRRQRQEAAEGCCSGGGPCCCGHRAGRAPQQEAAQGRAAEAGTAAAASSR